VPSNVCAIPSVITLHVDRLGTTGCVANISIARTVFSASSTSQSSAGAVRALGPGRALKRGLLDGLFLLLRQQCGVAGCIAVIASGEVALKGRLIEMLRVSFTP
jgi:hypothetical protein